MSGFALALVALMSASASGSAPAQSRIQGEWKISPADHADRVQLELHRSWRNGSSRGSSTSSFDVKRADLSGIDSRAWASGHAPVQFDLVRDAGSLHFEGDLRHGRGSGEYSFEPDPRFRAELLRAGFGSVEARR